ncbi:hypothetical protein PTKIN_Ptkin03bG0072800 [Pterospermum kingtungense]
MFALQDADLIMLALATHEIHFSILREDALIQEQLPVFQSARKPSNQVGESYSVKSRGWFKDGKTESGLKDVNTAKRYEPIAKRPYEFVHVWILREYLELDMKVTDAPENFRFDLERIIDDFIFMCFFAGNDFLPHMPTLEIHEGAIDLLMTVYKTHFKNIGGYLVDMQRVQDKKGGYVKLKRVEKFILQLSTFEEKIFKKRSELREHKLKKLCQYSDIEQDEENEIENSDLTRAVSNNSSADKHELLRNTKDLKQMLKENIRKKSDLFKNGNLNTDKVRLGFPGWKERYYKHKFSAETKQEIETKRKEIVQKYTGGLLWVLLYYYSGVPSWSWYYPYHYGPFASDLKGVSQGKIKFQKGHPFKPFDQLMSVLPPRSAHALPKPYAKLITDMDSSIIDFYPIEIEIDTDGKRFAWQGICKLPFIDEERLVVETRRVEKELTPEESERNVEKVDQLFVSNNLRTKILTLFQNLSPNEKVLMDANVSGFGGLVRLGNYDNLTSPSDILSLLFEVPDDNLHVPRPLEGVDYPMKTITAGQIQKTVLWHEYPGSRPPYNRPQSQATLTTANSSSKSSSSSTEIQKVAGTGWGAGRGASAFNSSIARGIADMRISESRHNFGSYGRGQAMTNTFWPSRNTSNQSSNHPWQLNSANALSQGQGWRASSPNPSSHSLGRGQSVWNSRNGRNSNSAWQLNSANASSQGQGRGQFNPSTSASKWHSRDSTGRFS